MEYKKYNNILDKNKKKLLKKLNFNFLNKSEDFFIKLDSIPTNEREKSIKFNMKNKFKMKTKNNNYIKATLTNKLKENRDYDFFNRYSIDDKIKNNFKKYLKNSCIFSELDKKTLNLISYMSSIDFDEICNYSFKTNIVELNKFSKKSIMNDELIKNFSKKINLNKEKVIYNEELFLDLLAQFKYILNDTSIKNKTLFLMFKDFLSIYNFRKFHQIYELYKLFRNKWNKQNINHKKELDEIIDTLTKLKVDNTKLNNFKEENIKLKGRIKDMKLFYESKISELIDHSKSLETKVKSYNYSYNKLSYKVNEYKDFLLQIKNEYKMKQTDNLKNMKNYLDYLVNDISELKTNKELVENVDFKTFNYKKFKYILKENIKNNSLYLHKQTQTKIEIFSFDKGIQYSIEKENKFILAKVSLLNKKVSVHFKDRPIIKIEKKDSFVSIEKDFKSMKSIKKINKSSIDKNYNIQNSIKYIGKRKKKSFNFNNNTNTKSEFNSNCNISIYNDDDNSEAIENSYIMVKKSIKKMDYFFDEDQNYFRFQNLNHQEVKIFKKIFYKNKIKFLYKKLPKTMFNLVFYITKYFQFFLNLKTKDSFIESLKFTKNLNNIFLIKSNIIVNNKLFNNINHNNKINVNKDKELSTIYNEIILKKSNNNNKSLVDSILDYYKYKFSVDFICNKRFHNLIIYLLSYSTYSNDKLSNIKYLLNFECSFKELLKDIYDNIKTIFIDQAKLEDSNIYWSNKLFLNNYSNFFKKVILYFKSNNLFDYNILNKINFLKLTNWQEELKTKKFNFNKFSNRIILELSHNKNFIVKYLFNVLNEKNIIKYDNLKLIFIFIKEKELISIFKIKYLKKKINYFDFINLIDWYKIDIFYLLNSINNIDRFSNGIFSFEILKLIYNNKFVLKIKKKLENEDKCYLNYLKYIENNINKLNENIYIKDKIWIKFKNIENIIIIRNLKNLKKKLNKSNFN